MGFFWSSLDDSADQKTQNIFVVAGFVTTQDRWTEIERKWTLRLEQERPPIKYFRATDCKSRSRQFHRFRDASKYTREAGIAAAQSIRDDLKQILVSSTVVAIATAL